MKKNKEANTEIGFNEVNEKLDRVIDTMATKDDIADIRAEMATRRELQALDGKFSSKFQEVIAAVDGLMKPISELKMEYAGMTMQLGRHEERLSKLENKQ